MKSHVERKLLAAAVASCIGLAVPVTAAADGPFSATRAVIAIVDGELFVGEAEGHLNGAGTIAIYSQKNPALTCIGEFRSSAIAGGIGNMRCLDGATADFHFERLTAFRGHGAGTSSRGAMSFVYGLTVEESAPYLALPGGKKFSPAGTKLTLVDQ
jgi:hypothetical protein